MGTRRICWLARKTGIGFSYLLILLLILPGSAGAKQSYPPDVKPAAAGALSGFVRDDRSVPVANATVTIVGSSFAPAHTDATGFYQFSQVPSGLYTVRAAASACNQITNAYIWLPETTTQNFTLPLRYDSYGYYCTVEEPNYISGTDYYSLHGNNDWSRKELPFPFPFYGEYYSTFFGSTNGYVNFLRGNAIATNYVLPTTEQPNAAIYPFWDDLYADDGISSAWTLFSGEAPNRKFLVEWRNFWIPTGTGERLIDFTLTLHEDGQIEFQYRNIDDHSRERGDSATIGLENRLGTFAYQYSYNQPILPAGQSAIRFHPPATRLVAGTIVDANDQLPVPGATVKARKPDGIPVETTADEQGYYEMRVPLGVYDLEASHPNYQPSSSGLHLTEANQSVVRSYSLTTPLLIADPAALQFSAPAGQTSIQLLAITNTGTLSATWEANEAGGWPDNTLADILLDKPSITSSPLSPEVQASPSNWTPTAPGQVIRSWEPPGIEYIDSIGFDGNVWLAGSIWRDVLEFTPTGVPTGRKGTFTGRGLASLNIQEMCQLINDPHLTKGIYCWDKDTSALTRSITGDFSWLSDNIMMLTYRPDSDSFYVSTYSKVIYNVAGFSHAVPGQELSQCSYEIDSIRGLAWNEAVGQLWASTFDWTDNFYLLDSHTCAVVSTLPHPNPDHKGGGIAIDTAGNLWLNSNYPNRIYLVDSGVPAFTDVPWLSTIPPKGSLAAGETRQLAVQVNTASLAPGEYTAIVVISSNSGRERSVSIPLTLRVLEPQPPPNVVWLPLLTSSSPSQGSSP